MLRRKKTPRRGGAFGFFAPSSFDPLPPDLAPCRVFLPPQVAGLHRAVPSAALDKVIQFYKGILYQVFPVCQLGFEKYSLSRNYNQKKPHEIRQKEIPATWRGFLKGVNYSSMSITTPEPTVRPPSRMAKRRPFSMAMGVISSTSMSTLSPGMHISVPSGREMMPVTSVVRK